MTGTFSSISVPWPPGRRKGLEIELTETSDMTYHTQVMDPPWKWICEAWRHSVWWNSWRLWRVVNLEGAWKLLTPSLHVALCISSIWLFLNRIFYNELEIVKWFPEFCELFLQITEPKEEAIRTPDSQPIDQPEPWEERLKLEQFCWTETLTCGVCDNSK